MGFAIVAAVFDHVTIRVADREASARFYEIVLAALELRPEAADADAGRWGELAIAAAHDDAPVTRGLHIGFVAGSRAAVDAFWRAGVEAGYRDDGAPGPRPQYRPDYYGGFLLDPDGNSAEAVHHGALPAGRVIDHLWIRVADVAAATRFYEAIAPHAGLDPRVNDADHTWVKGRRGSFSLVAGRPTEHLHMALAAEDDAAVEAFHRAALEAGYRDARPPGSRRVHGRDGYAASVLDPHANTIEIVHRSAGPTAA
jgi:catechol 2,3-dioxygenase-like lactoylglutathione lyase family enzyme